MSSVTGSHLEQQGPDTVTINRHSLYCPFPLGLASGSCLWVLPLVQRMLRKLSGRCGGGSRIRWDDPKPKTFSGGHCSPTPSCLWGSSLIPPGRMSNTDCLLALIWLPTAGGAGAAVVYIAVAACRPAESQECFPPMGQHHNSAE